MQYIQSLHRSQSPMHQLHAGVPLVCGLAHVHGDHDVAQVGVHEGGLVKPPHRVHGLSSGLPGHVAVVQEGILIISSDM